MAPYPPHLPLPQTPNRGTTAALFTATGGGVPQTVPLSLTIAPTPSCSLAVSSPTSPITITAGNCATVQVSCSAVQGKFSTLLSLSLKGAPPGVTATTSHLGVFNSTVSLSVTGLPAGVTASLSKTATPAPGDGTVVATFTAASTTKTGIYMPTLTATGGGQAQVTPITLTIAAK